MVYDSTKNRRTTQLVSKCMDRTSKMLRGGGIYAQNLNKLKELSFIIHKFCKLSLSLGSINCATLWLGFNGYSIHEIKGVILKMRYSYGSNIYN